MLGCEGTLTFIGFLSNIGLSFLCQRGCPVVKKSGQKALLLAVNPSSCPPIRTEASGCPLKASGAMQRTIKRIPYQGTSVGYLQGDWWSVQNWQRQNSKKCMRANEKGMIQKSQEWTWPYAVTGCLSCGLKSRERSCLCTFLAPGSSV